MSLPDLGTVEDTDELRVKIRELEGLYRGLYILLTDPDLTDEDVAFLLSHNRRKAVSLGVSFEGLTRDGLRLFQFALPIRTGSWPRYPNDPGGLPAFL